MSIKLDVCVSCGNIGDLSRLCPHVEHGCALVTVRRETCVLSEVTLVVQHITTEHASHLDVELNALPHYCGVQTA